MISLLHKICCSVVAGLLCCKVQGQEQIIPRPVSIQYPSDDDKSPIFLDSGTGIICMEKDPVFLQRTHALKLFLAQGTGLSFGDNPTTGLIRISRDTSLLQYGPEAYRMELTPGLIHITSATPKGIYYAGQSLAQMLSSPFFTGSKEKKTPVWKVADKSCVILDYPRFAWRAFMLDEARHFFGEKEVKKLIDQMGLLKMNILHWHLSDDAGWRIQIKKYPELTSVGSKRKDTERETWGSGKYAGKPHEGFYTQEQIRRIVHYAQERNITVIPEIDVPGHSAAAIVSCLALHLSARPLQEIPASFTDGAALDPSSEDVYEFLDNVMTELAELFPAKIIHMGGDEVRYKKYWEGVPHLDAFMKKKGIKTFPDLQIMFTNRIAAMLARKGCRVVGWNEILGSDVHQDGGQGAALGELDKGAIIHFWYGADKIAAQAIKDGRQVINSTSRMTYINKDYQALPLEKSYSFEPVFAGLPEQYHKNVIGLGCQVWTEWIPDVEKLHRRVFPRIAAYAEIGWSRKEDKNFVDFQRRVVQWQKILSALNIPFGDKL